MGITNISQMKSTDDVELIKYESLVKFLQPDDLFLELRKKYFVNVWKILAFTWQVLVVHL